MAKHFCEGGAGTIFALAKAKNVKIALRLRHGL